MAAGLTCHSLRSRAEGLGWFTLASGLAFVSFWTGEEALLLLLPPAMMLAALRFDKAASVTMLALVVSQALLATSMDRGPLLLFGDTATAVTVFVLASIASTILPAILLKSARNRIDARADFLASISHDIRTPMNGVLGFTDLLRQGELTPEQRRSVDHIAESGQTMVRLLNDILDYSRLEAGGLQLAQDEVDLHGELAYAAALFQPRAGEKGIALSCDIDRHVPRRIRGDGLRIRQVLLNLVGNAVKFTDHGHVRICAHAHRGRLATEVLIEVADSGIGMEAQALGRIFEKYGQAARGKARSRGGAGLGLAISRHLVELMEGRIEVTSQDGEGSCFTVRIPVQEIPDLAAATPLRQASPQGQGRAVA